MRVPTPGQGGAGAGALAVALACALAASCVGTEAAPHGPGRPPHAENCPVQLFPKAHPTYPSVDLVPVRAVCNRALGRAACLDKLHTLTCAAGGDTAYGFKEGINPDGAGMFISAMVARRSDVPPASSSGASAATAGPAATAAPVDDAAGQGCTPICSPGFACQAGQCIAECNPACAPTEICNRHRTCEPAAPEPAPAK